MIMDDTRLEAKLDQMRDSLAEIKIHIAALPKLLGVIAIIGGVNGTSNIYRAVEDSASAERTQPSYRVEERKNQADVDTNPWKISPDKPVIKN